MSFGSDRKKDKENCPRAFVPLGQPIIKRQKNKRDSVGSRVLSRTAPALIGSGVRNGRLVDLASGNGPRGIGLRAALDFLYLPLVPSLRERRRRGGFGGEEQVEKRQEGF